MIKTILGLVLLLLPFLLVVKFQDRKKGFFCILAFFIFFHLITAIITQSLGIFNYPVILSVNIFSCLIIILKTNFKELKNLKENIKKIDLIITKSFGFVHGIWGEPGKSTQRLLHKCSGFSCVLIFILLVISLQLSQVHFNYTGKISDINNDSVEVKNIRYIYPYFSDEWVAVSLINYSIEAGKLPLVNPLWKNTCFPNLEFAFHSFLSEFFLLLDLNPLTFYSVFSVIFGLLICFLVYSVLTFNKASRFASALSALSIPLITNSGNFLGIWYLIPIVLGLVCMLICFIFMSINEQKMVLFSSFLVLIFYPPAFIILSFALIPYFLLSDKKPAENLFLYLSVCFSVAVILIFSIKKFISLEFIISKLYYMNFTYNMIPDYSIWKIIPLFTIVFGILGLIKFREKIFLFLPALVGLAFWSLYSVILWRFAIGYERVVFITAVLIIIISGFGMDFAFNFLNKYINKKTIKILKIIIILIFLFSTVNYTSSSKWESIKFSYNGKIINPMPPANIYLQEEDLKLFRNIKEKTFIASPWKGLVIGVAAKNYPIDSKHSAITNQIFSYEKFMKLNCEEKKEAALKYEIDYAYSKNFTCKYFKPIGESYENLILYEFSF